MVFTLRQRLGRLWIMTKQKIKALKAKIELSRARLMSTIPFFAMLLMYLKFIAVPNMKKISTNGKCIYFSPNFVDKLYEYELDFVLSHQIMHIVMENIWRKDDLAGDNYHFACDILINRLLENYGFGEETYSHLGYIYRRIPNSDIDVTQLSAEEIYRNLPFSLYVFDEKTRSKYLVDSDLYWNNKYHTEKEEILIIDTAEQDYVSKQNDIMNVTSEQQGSEDAINGLKQLWQARISTAYKYTSENGNNDMGQNTDFLARIIKNIKAPVFDWKRILDEFLQESTYDYSFTPPDRRYDDADFFMPDLNEKEFAQRDFLFMVDTSGSVDDENLSVVYSEIKGIIEQFSGKLSGTLGFFDSDVKTPQPFKEVEDLMNIIPYGGGGTNFSPIFDYVRSYYHHQPPSCIIIFTDGKAVYPPKSAANDIPVLWIINNSDITPPWGKTIRLTSYTQSNYKRLHSHKNVL